MVRCINELIFLTQFTDDARSPTTIATGIFVNLNRPLQWAVQNKHRACVKTLLELCPEPSQMNVLDKNGFGKSALTDVRHRVATIFLTSTI